MVPKWFKVCGVAVVLFLSAQSVLAAGGSPNARKGWSTKGCTTDSDDLSCARYVKNYDGDTITFDIPNVHPLIGDEIMVRLKGVDTPEIRTRDNCEKEKGFEAQRVVENLLTNADRIDLINPERGKYFRVLADILIDGESLADELLKRRLAVPYHGKTKPDVNWCGR
ncbi:MAG: thermonuclease family protein [Bdellovibrionales bacterium]|nr:thermonuclease family protein [Bdellovibrionales bacterium]